VNTLFSTKEIIGNIKEINPFVIAIDAPLVKGRHYY